MAEESTEADPVYLFDPRDEERRLVAQARLFDPLTERLFREAGVTSGMRVLDLGSGVGDTAMLAARLVGPDGSVLGVDLSSERLAVARSRACDAGLENVEFVQGDLLSLDLGDREFDAIVGRPLPHSTVFTSDRSRTIIVLLSWVVFVTRGPAGRLSRGVRRRLREACPLGAVPPSGDMCRGTTSPTVPLEGGIGAVDEAWS